MGVTLPAGDGGGGRTDRRDGKEERGQERR